MLVSGVWRSELWFPWHVHRHLKSTCPRNPATAQVLQVLRKSKWKAKFQASSIRNPWRGWLWNIRSDKTRQAEQMWQEKEEEEEQLENRCRHQKEHFAEKFSSRIRWNRDQTAESLSRRMSGAVFGGLKIFYANNAANSMTETFRVRAAAKRIYFSLDFIMRNQVCAVLMETSLFELSRDRKFGSDVKIRRKMKHKHRRTFVAFDFFGYKNGEKVVLQ